MSKPQRCDSCLYWVLVEAQHHPDDRRGECHRRAPSPTIGDWHYEVLKFLSTITWRFADDEQKQTEFNQWEESERNPACWPFTSADEWCGEWEKKKQLLKES